MEIHLNQAHNHDDDSTDACSIFCYCNCCSGNVTAPGYQLPEIVGIPISIYFDRRMPLLNSPIISSYFGNIWQPPKINA